MTALATGNVLVPNRVSIVAPCYNVEQFLTEFLDSLLAQTYKDLEIILVNDGATDRTGEMLREAKPRLEAEGYLVKLIEQQNKGLGGAVDTGLKHFTGEFLMWPDPDDWLTPESVERRVQIMRQNPDVGLLRTNARLFVQDRGEFDGHWFPVDTPAHRPVRLFEDFLYMRYFFAPVCHMVRSEMFLRVHPDRSIFFTRASSQNFQLLVPLVEAYPVLQVGEPLANYRVREDSRSRATKTHESLMRRFDQLYELADQTIPRLRTYRSDAHQTLRNFHWRMRMLPTAFRGAMYERASGLVEKSAIPRPRKVFAQTLLRVRCNPVFRKVDQVSGRIASRALARTFDATVRMPADEMRWGRDPVWAEPEAGVGGLQSVVSGGYCVGCGVCSALDPRIRMERDEMERYQALLPQGPVRKEAERACPFADGTASEDEIAGELYTDPELRRDSNLGVHLETFAGWVEEEDFRKQGSSGGMGAWLLCELLRKGLVDQVVHVAEMPRTPDDADAPLFAFKVSTTEAEVRAHAKSRYYPVELSDVVSHILATPGRYAVVAVPCFAKALRLAARQSAPLAERLAFVVGIVCGHLKSGAFAESLAWQCGIAPPDLVDVDFRMKLEGRPASRYGLRVDGLVDGRPVSVTRPMEGLIGANWGHGLFKLKACEFCDDVLAETADVTVGDAWLPQYDADSRGTNVAVVRHRQVLTLMQEAAAEGRLRLDDLSAQAVAASQAGGLRHRRDGLAYRLWLADREGVWRPNKRVSPKASHLTPKLQRIHRLRYALGQASHAAFLQAKQAGDFTVFTDKLTPLIRRYDREQSRSLARRVAGYAKRTLFGSKRAAGA
ncbi:MAG: glycosyltransferase [Acidobacteria bacterium]|nr:glycosyltransferase [Acidobacteriota bacterium]